MHPKFVKSVRCCLAFVGGLGWWAGVGARRGLRHGLMEVGWNLLVPPLPALAGALECCLEELHAWRCVSVGGRVDCPDGGVRDGWHERPGDERRGD